LKKPSSKKQDTKNAIRRTDFSGNTKSTHHFASLSSKTRSR
jgi:hypothetical protein